MMMTVSDKHAAMRGALERIAMSYEQGGRLLYSGRNEVRCFDIDGQSVVVKRFRRLGMVRSFYYRLVRPSKAQRAYDNAHELLRRGFATPEPVAWFGDGRTFFYACLHTDAQPVKGPLIESQPRDDRLVVPYARFVAQLHERGVLHRDLNPTNVLYTPCSDGGHRFELIDINRMEFFDTPVPRPQCMENLTLFWWLSDVYMDVLRAYAEARGWTEADVEKAVGVKQRHDRRWVRRKRFTGRIKRLLGRHR